ncbi:MAG: hypothetical protein HY392_05530 [Candidatus Diapherotrites archaeon]|nr:hypothetical protein [Candidatus Diapherotrites archaeon]
MQKKKKTETELKEDPYDSDDVEEMLEDDEMESKEAGFMEGYNEKQSEKPKKIKRVINEK